MPLLTNCWKTCLFAILDTDLKSLQCKLHNWSIDDMETLSVVYRTIDLNEDGLIDFIEL